MAVTLLVKNPGHEGPAALHYYDIGDYLSREDKLSMVAGFGDLSGIPWQSIRPNTAGDWINQRSELFETFLPLGDKKDRGKAIFDLYSNGVKTNRDAWAYNFSCDALLTHMKATIDVYNEQRNRFAEQVRVGKVRATDAAVSAFVDPDPTKVSWTAG